MGLLRTREDIESEYTAVRAAYLRSLEAQEYRRSDGVDHVEVQRASPRMLRIQMLELEAELARSVRGGISVRPTGFLDE